VKDNSKSDKKPRLPPGQHLTDRFPVLQKGGIPRIDRENYKLEISGEVDNPVILSLEDLNKIQDKEIVADIHCVTGWTRFNSKWKGISFKKLFELSKPTKKAKFMEFYCADGGFTTTVPIEAFKENTILALSYDGKPIDDKHGGPVRPILPDLYFYKSAKWVLKTIFLEKDRLGYWERAGYSNKADPWKAQRYSSDDNS
jgi:DMSO/TMAO reductase YedYZ molybdopterin-dependent catalytic subunit